MSGLLRVVRVDARLVPHRWVWAEENAAAIAANWERRRRLAPAIFNGRVLMVAGLDEAPGEIRARFFATDYANLLGWTDAGRPDGSVANGFAMGALEAADGAFLLGRMASHTANAGKLYFPCGTPDLGDVGEADRVELLSSLVREIEEETGLPHSELDVGGDWIVVRASGLIAFMRRVRLPFGAEEARARILAHLARESEPELSDIRIVRSFADIAGEDVPATVPIFLEDAFARGNQG